MKQEARFLTGSTMRHVIVMTMTGMIGLTFLFLVDAVTLFWVSQLNREVLMAAMGYAWTVQFFTISASVGLMIATLAMVSKSIGRKRFVLARKQATVGVVVTCAFLCIVAVFLSVFRTESLMIIGATGESLALATRFLAISIPSLPIMGLGMASSAILRAEGDGVKAMYITIFSGIVALFIDPFLIFTLNLGLDGAALGVVIARVASTMLALWMVIYQKNLLAWINLQDLRRHIRPFVIIAIPALMTQMASPFGNFVITWAISDYGESAVAGWAVLSRLTVLAFGGIFALSGAIGGIIGQNYGAGRIDRVRTAYRDALIFSSLYVLVVWMILISMTGVINTVFRLSPDAQEVVWAFTTIGSAGFIFAGALYVSNAAFNNMGRPFYSTLFNWIKDGLLMWPFCMMGSVWLMANGVIYGQAVAFVVAGSLAAFVGWRFIGR